MDNIDGDFSSPTSLAFDCITLNSDLPTNTRNGSGSREKLVEFLKDVHGDIFVRLQQKTEEDSQVVEHLRHNHERISP